MSAPLLFIIVPLAVAVLLFLIQNHRVMTSRIAVILCLVLALVAFAQPIGNHIVLGSLAINFKDNMEILGRGFYLQNSDRFILVFIFLSAAVWFGGANTAQTPRMFVPVGLAITSIMIGAMAVEPFLYAAVLLELAAILTIPLLLTRNQLAGAGILRFFIFQAIALPVILLAGWMLGDSQGTISNEAQLTQASILLGLGFSFWLAVFPFYPWVPLVMKESHPYTAGFILCMQSVVVIVIIMDYLNGFIWLRDTAALYPILRIVGTVMVVTAGVWAAFQQDARRLFGYVVIIENGFALVSIGLRSALAFKSLYYQFIPHMTALAVFALSLAVMMKELPDTEYKDLKGLLKRKPFAAGAMLVSLFSLMGLPVLASFPSRMAQFELLAPVSTPTLIWLFAGLGGLFLAAIRILTTLIGDNETHWQISEKPGEIILLSLAVFSLLLMGMFPQILSSLFSPLLTLISFLSG